MKYHHAPRPTAPLTNAKCSIVPHETWTGSPSPRNASVASARMQPAITSTAFAKIRGATLGRMCLVIWRRCVDPDRPDPHHELAFAKRQHLRAHDAGDGRPGRQTDHQDEDAQALTEYRCEDDHERDRRQHQEEVGDAHQARVDPTSEVPGDQSDRSTRRRSRSRWRTAPRRSRSSHPPGTRGTRRGPARRCRASAPATAAARMDAAVFPTSVGSNGQISGPTMATTKITASRITPARPVRSCQISLIARPVVAHAPELSGMSNIPSIRPPVPGDRARR